MRRSLRRVARLPAIRLLLPFASGIMLQWLRPTPPSALFVPVGLLLFTLLLSWLPAVLHARGLRIRSIPTSASGLLIPLRFFLAGTLLTAAGMLHAGTALRGEGTALLRFADRRDRVLLTGVVDEDPRVSSGRLRFRLRSRLALWADSADGTAADGATVRGSVLVSYRRSAWSDDDTLRQVQWGDVVTLRCRLRTPLPPRNPGGFDARTWMIGEGCLLFCSVSKGTDLQVIGHEDSGPAARMITAVRGWTRGTLRRLYPEEHAALMTGLLLGDRGMIGQETMEDFRDAGVMHILAVSGLHAGIVLLIVFMPLERLRYPLRAALALLGLWFFAAMTGLAPPVVRAALMSTLFLGGAVLQRRGDPVNALAAAALIILLIDPLALLGLSFQLSFAAVLGILLFHERLQNLLLHPLPYHLREGWARIPAGLIALTLSAQSLSLPLLARSFGMVSPAGLLANLAAVPMVFVAVTTGILSLGAAALPWLAGCFAATASAALDAILISSSAAADLPFATLPVPALSVTASMLYLAAVAWLSASEGRLRQRFVLLFAAVLAAWIILRPTPADDALLRVTFLDVGQGDAAVIHLPGGTAVLVDAGPGDESYDAGTRVILPYLQRSGVRSLHALAITHPDNDHRGGAGAVIDALPVRHVLLGGTWPEDGAAGRLLTRMRERCGRIHDARAGDRFPLPGGAVLQVLSPPRDSLCEASNEHSVVLQLAYGRTRFLLTGDADVEAEGRMTARYDSLLRCDVLKVGHHGSSTSSASAFLTAAHPRYAVISAGRNNRFRHPRPEIERRLLRGGAQIVRTDIEGAVTFASDGTSVWKMDRVK